MEEDVGKASIALQARMMSKLMRKWVGLIGRKDIIAIFVNQLRTDINSRFGDPNVTTGGRALAYYSSIRFGMNSLKIQAEDPIKAEDGLKIGARVAKNRCVYDNPYKKCEFYVRYGEGVDKLFEVMENAPDAGILRKAGAWFYYEEEDGQLITAEKAIVAGVETKNVPLKFQGKATLREFLGENEWFAQQLMDEIRGKAKRGELLPKFQNEEELKEIEELKKLERDIEKEMTEFEKEALKNKASATKAKTSPTPKAKARTRTKPQA